MRKIDRLCAFLGDPYVVRVIDMEDVIYRLLGNYEFEISGVHSGTKQYRLYIWQVAPRRELMGICHNICGDQVLKDILGYYAVKLQNLLDQIQVEREV